MIKEPTTQETDKKTLTSMPEYTSIEKIHITNGVLKSLIKFTQNSENKQVEGFLFGHEEENEIIVETAFPALVNATNVESETNNIVEYLRLNRLDFVQVGFFLCKEFTEKIKKRTFKRYIDFQTKFPNAVFIFYDNSLYKENDYPFQCFRFTKHVMDLIDNLDIEEDQQDISKKSIPSDELLKNLNFSIVENQNSFFSTLTSVNAFENIQSDSSYDNKSNLLMRINEVNKKSESFIEEQKKYINYYKVKRQYGKTKESEFLELLNKKGSELANLDKIDMTILSVNILNMNERIKTLVDHVNVKNVFNLEI